MERCPSGLRCRPAKSVNIILVPRVQIPLFPPRNISKIRENRNGKKESKLKYVDYAIIEIMLLKK